jgi:hypothetical protein
MRQGGSKRPGSNDTTTNSKYPDCYIADTGADSKNLGKLFPANPTDQWQRRS